MLFSPTALNRPCHIRPSGFPAAFICPRGVRFPVAAISATGSKLIVERSAD